jgi:hypothetical protein
MKNQNIVLSPGGMEALQARFALRVAARLSEGSRDLPHDITERLKSARELALTAARQARRLETSEAADAVGHGGGTVVLGGPGRRSDWWLKLASLAPIVALVAGFVAIDHLHVKSQIKAAAEIDAALLADDVPPAAYSDPGFVEFLKAPRD